jgi:predicted dehydrogenase
MKIKRSKDTKKLTRRVFLQRTAMTAAGAVLTLPTIITSSVRGANAPSNRITIGGIGLGAQGSWIIRGFMSQPAAQVVAICDVDTNHRESAQNTAGLAAKSAYNDFRDLLARDDIDAVIVAAPDHWHVPISIAAAKAGKDIYCEKPLTLTIGEGRRLCNTVKRYGRVLQTGSQQRSVSRFRFACELVRNGRIGKLHTIRVEIPKNTRTSPIDWQVEEVPKGFDYNMWLGPAPWAPYTKHRCHYEFRFIFDYSGGQMTNWGAHYLDIAQWGNGTDYTGPVAIVGRAQFPKHGLFTTATKMNVEYTYANGVKLICTTRSDDANAGKIRFEGSDGWVFVNRSRIDAHPKSILSSTIGPNETHMYNSTDHSQDFLDCVKLRKEPVTGAEIGHRSASLCHLGNIATLLGRKLKWNPEKELFINDTTAARMLTRSMRSPWRI